MRIDQKKFLRDLFFATLFSGLSWYLFDRYIIPDQWDWFGITLMWLSYPIFCGAFFFGFKVLTAIGNRIFGGTWESGTH